MVPEKEIETAYLQSMMECERLSLPSNLLLLAGVAFCGLFLASPLHVLCVVLLRLTAIGIAHIGARHVQQQLEEGVEIRSALRLMKAGLAFSGITWALLLTIIPPDGFTEPAAVIILCCMAAGVSIITMMLAANSGAMHIYLGSFLAAGTIWMAMNEWTFNLAVMMGGVFLMVALHDFSVRIARMTRRSAELRVEHKRMAHRLALALKQQSQLALTDSLTHIANRRGFELHARDIRSRSVARVSGYHLLLIDLDHFKKINDVAGHSIGDSVLSDLGRVLKDFSREFGEDAQASRLGGEEFTLLLPKRRDDSAAAIAEDVRLRIAELTLRQRSPQIHISASIGIAHWDGRSDIFTALGRADNAMYRAKEGGRNRYCLAAAA